MALTAAERAWCVVVPHHPRGAGQARSRLAAEIGRVVRPELLADVVSVAAELVGNAVRHATPLPGGVIRVAWLVRLTADMQTVEVRVTDGGRQHRAAGADVRLRLDRRSRPVDRGGTRRALGVRTGRTRPVRVGADHTSEPRPRRRHDPLDRNRRLGRRLTRSRPSSRWRAVGG